MQVSTGCAGTVKGMDPNPPVNPGPPPEPPFLSLHTAVVLLTALVIGLITGALTALTGVSAAGAVLAGLAAAGPSVPVLRSLVGASREGAAR
ncbi:hypothetical protein [Streptomyces sp. NPDC058291]|jgi:hypothetical protein|uniref:hypothetical protein n=1 Tax=Streptomyces sp. NPDC058291 TaxID=3346427 RepID=UPI0036E491E7